MKLRNPKLLAMASAVALGVAAFGTTPVKAQTQVNAQFITASAITVTPGNTMDFGEYLIQVAGGDNPTLTLSNDGNAAITVGGTTSNSQIVQITAPAQAGSLTVETPAPATLTMTRVAASTNDFGDAGLSLTAVSWRRTGGSNGNINADGATATVTTTGGAPDTITFGGTITITATPTDATHTADFDISFAY